MGSLALVTGPSYSILTASRPALMACVITAMSAFALTPSPLAALFGCALSILRTELETDHPTYRRSCRSVRAQAPETALSASSIRYHQTLQTDAQSQSACDALLLVPKPRT